jgi:hypothetical protein
MGKGQNNMTRLCNILFLNNSYVTEACSHGFQCLYDNVGGAVESMANFWRYVASTFKDSPNVIGLVLMSPLSYIYYFISVYKGMK